MRTPLKRNAMERGEGQLDGDDEGEVLGHGAGRPARAVSDLTDRKGLDPSTEGTPSPEVGVGAGAPGSPATPPTELQTPDDRSNRDNSQSAPDRVDVDGISAAVDSSAAPKLSIDPSASPENKTSSSRIGHRAGRPRIEVPTFDHVWQSIAHVPGRWRCETCGRVANTGLQSHPAVAGCPGWPAALRQVGQGHRILRYNVLAGIRGHSPAYACDLCHRVSTGKRCSRKPATKHRQRSERRPLTG